LNLVKYIILFFVICNSLSAQQDSVTSKLVLIDSLNMDGAMALDTSIVNNSDTVLSINDTLRLSENNAIFAEEGIESKIDYGSLDSSYTDLVKNEIHLYGDAFVKYQNYSLKADYIIFNFDTNIASAFTVIDTSRHEIVKPIFQDGTTKFEYESLKYNFKTKKGIVSDAITKEGEFYLLGTKTKFVTNTIDSSGTEEQVVYNERALITTCDLDHPHFGIRASKLKVIPEKLAVIGPSQLEIAGVPTPILLPFGFFPLTDGASSGLIFPKDFDYNPELGLTFRDIGYYFPINEYFDLKLTADIYTRGSWAVKLNSQYKQRYAYNGNVSLSYFNWVRDDVVTGGKLKQTSFSINIAHNQDPKAHPYRSLGGSVNISGNRFNQRQSNEASDRLNNVYTSNFNYKHSLPGTPFSFRMGFAHSQNTQTRKVDITLPNASLNMNTIFPFKRKNQAGGEKWFEKIALKYDASLQNMTTTSDTTIFTNETLDNLRTGLQHRASMNTSTTVAKYFQVSPSVNYTENWYLNETEKIFNDQLVYDADSIDVDPEGNIIYDIDTTFGQIITQKNQGFYTFRDYSVNLAVGTQLFGTKKFGSGLIRGIRHVMKPSITFSYAPSSQDRYQLLVDTDTRDVFNDPESYNPFQGNPYSPSLRDKQMTLNYSIANVLEAKLFSKKDSTEKNIKLFNSFNINGNYNFAADSLKWSDVSMSGNSSIYKGLTTIRFSGSFRPYVTNEKGKVINKTIWDTKKRPVEFRNFRLNIDTGFSFRQIKDLIAGKEDKKKKGVKDKAIEEEEQERAIKPHRTEKKKELTSFADLFDSFRISHNLQYNVQRMNDGRDTSYISTNAIRLSGAIKLSENWGVNIGNLSYNFQTKTFPYPTFSLTRNLHCWQMRLSWYPSTGTYGFFIGVNSGALNFLKYEYGQQNNNNFFGG
jgi:hypothetical protein